MQGRLLSPAHQRGCLYDGSFDVSMISQTQKNSACTVMNPLQTELEGGDFMQDDMGELYSEYSYTPQEPLNGVSEFATDSEYFEMLGEDS